MILNLFNKNNLFKKIFKCFFISCLFLCAITNIASADSYVGRGELAVILVERLGIELSQYEGKFNDVTPERSDALAIEAACSVGYFKCPERDFRPDDILDRVSLAIILKDVYEAEFNVTEIAPYASFYSDYADMTKEHRDAVDVVSMMDLMRGKTINQFKCYEMATEEDVNYAIERIEHLIWRNRKIKLSYAVANAVENGADNEQRWDLWNEICDIAQDPRGGVIEYDVSALGLDEYIIEEVGMQADTTLNCVGNAIAICMDSSSNLYKYITEVFVEEISVDYVAVPGRILLAKENFPVSGVYEVCIKSTVFPDFVINQLIYDKERVNLIPAVK